MKSWTLADIPWDRFDPAKVDAEMLRLVEAFHHAVRGRQDDAIASLQRLFDKAEMPFMGWTIPVEPLLDKLRGTPAFQGILARLAERAR